MHKKQKLFSEFYKTMSQMRRLLSQTLGDPSRENISTMLQGQALEYINENPRLTAGDLAGGLQMSSSAVTQLTNRLLAVNYISRKHSQIDRRAIHFELTIVGKKHLHELLTNRKMVASKILSSMSENDFKEVIRIFNNVLEKNK